MDNTTNLEVRLQAGAIVDIGRNIVCVGYKHGDDDYLPNWSENCRRIAAAVNFCKGRTTEELENAIKESNAVRLQRLKNEVLALEIEGLKQSVKELNALVESLSEKNHQAPGELVGFPYGSVVYNECVVGVDPYSDKKPDFVQPALRHNAHLVTPESQDTPFIQVIGRSQRPASIPDTDPSRYYPF